MTASVDGSHGFQNLESTCVADRNQKMGKIGRQEDKGSHREKVDDPNLRVGDKAVVTHL